MENILVVSKKHIEKHKPTGILNDDIQTEFFGYDFHFRPRTEELESDENYKQIIPYNFLVSEEGFYIYQRTKKGGENRLYDKWSLGIGGHLNDEDLDGDTWLKRISNCIEREIKEEVGIVKFDDYTWSLFKEFIYDPSNSVGKVHLGIVNKILVDNPENVKPKDNSISNGRWVKINELINMEKEGKFENWSSLLIKHWISNFHNIV